MTTWGVGIPTTPPGRGASLAAGGAGGLAGGGRGARRGERDLGKSRPARGRGPRADRCLGIAPRAGGRVARHAARDPRRTFGYYRLEILSAAVNGMLLCGIAASIAYSAWGRLHGNAQLDLARMAETSGVALVANLIGLGVLTRGHGSSLNVKAAVFHLAGDVASGVMVVLSAGLIAWTHFTLLDPILSLVIAVAIVWGAVRLLAEAVDILLEAVPQHMDLAHIREHIQRASGVQAVHDLHLWTISSGLYALSAHLVVGGCDIQACDDILTRVKRDLHEHFGIDTHHVADRERGVSARGRGALAHVSRGVARARGACACPVGRRRSRGRTSRDRRAFSGG